MTFSSRRNLHVQFEVLDSGLYVGQRLILRGILIVGHLPGVTELYCVASMIFWSCSCLTVDALCDIGAPQTHPHWVLNGQPKASSSQHFESGDGFL